jgi:hypothetical protein
MAKRVRVEVTGLRELFNTLETWDKKAAEQLRKRIRKAGQEVATVASYLVPGRNPISNWGQWISSRDGRDLGFDPAAASRGFKVRQNNFRRRGVSAGLGFDAYQSNPGGSIFELMGKGSTPMVESVRDRFPRRQPRSLFAAYYRVMTPELQDEIRDAIIDEARKAGLN